MPSGRGVIPGTRLSTQDFLSRYGNLAQSSQYYAHITLPSDVRAVVSRQVRNTGILNQSGVLCRATSLPGSSISTHDVRDFYGVTQKHAYARAFDGTVDLTFYIDSDYDVLTMFEVWMEYIMELNGASPQSTNTYYRAQYPESYRGPLFIHKFNKDDSAPVAITGPTARGHMEYEFINAFPQNISSTSVSYDSSNILEFTVTFSYERYVISRGMNNNSSTTGASTQNANNRRNQALLNASQNNPSNPWSVDSLTSPGGILQDVLQGDFGTASNNIASNRWVQQASTLIGNAHQALIDDQNSDSNASTQRLRQQQSTSVQGRAGGSGAVRSSST